MRQSSLATPLVSRNGELKPPIERRKGRAIGNWLGLVLFQTLSINKEKQLVFQYGAAQFASKIVALKWNI